MATGQHDRAQEYLASCRAEADRARTAGDTHQLCLALARLGLAHFRVRAFEAGLATFDEAIAMASGLDDLQLQTQCLGFKSLAFQEIERLHQAYETVEEIVQLAEAHDDQGMKCDALISQAQILADSGEPLVAFEKLKEARHLAEVLGDERRSMSVLGALGSLNLAVASVGEALLYFDKALDHAVRLGDRRAECRYALNKATVLTWIDDFSQALPVFERVRVLAEELEDPEAELISLRYLAEHLSKSADPARALPHGQRGLALSRTHDDRKATFSFYEAIILAHLRGGHASEARQTMRNAIECARAWGDAAKEVEMLINLGESCLVERLYEEALEAYQSALDGARRLQHHRDEANLVGRLGVVLAEMGRSEQAIAHHQQAVELARQHALPELEGEQLLMLALAYLDRQDAEQALSCCQNAIAVFASAKLAANEAKARELLAEISQATHSESR